MVTRVPELAGGSARRAAGRVANVEEARAAAAAAGRPSRIRVEGVAAGTPPARGGAESAGALALEQLEAVLKAAGESTRLRMLALLARGELTVKDLTRVLGQSQPRISRHLRLLVEAGLVERTREGSWAYFRLGHTGVARLARDLVRHLSADDATLERDLARADAVKRARAEAAQAFFRAHAREWDAIRRLHVAEDQVETAMRTALGEGPFELLVDIGTGTGRILELFADRARRGLGFDINRDMLAYARAKLERARLDHCQVRQGDLYSLPLADGEADAVVIHQVLHFLDDPGPALQEAARVLRPGGRLLVVDFAPHELEHLREAFAHQRLGFAAEEMEQWILQAGLAPLACHHLAPGRGADAGKLTVSLWLAMRPQVDDLASSAVEGRGEAAP